MVSVVICDDDRVTRGAVSALCEDLGLHVVAETDQWGAALELVRRFSVDILVLDLMLSDGSAEQTLEALREQDRAPDILMFSSYANDPGRLLRLGAREVIEKPDFAELGEALERLLSGTRIDVDHDERTNRRLMSREPEPLREVWRSPSGIASAADLPASLRALIDADSVLLVSLVGLEELEAAVGPALVGDCRLTLGRLLASTVRAQDMVHEVPDCDGYVALLRGGDERAAPSTWRRLVALAAAAKVPGRFVGVHRRVDPIGGADALARAIGALRSGDTMSSSA